MKRKRTTNPPPDAVYKAGKKKEHATNAIRALETVQAELRESIFNSPNLLGLSMGITEVLLMLKSYRKLLDE